MKNIYIRAFRAVDDKEASLKFVEGHRKVLENVGIKEVTSSNNEWIDNPGVYVILIESGDRSKIYGGARIHVANDMKPLPLEEATAEIDTNITSIVKEFAKDGTGEICGLWNSLEVAGYGVGSTYAIRSAICILDQIKIKSCFALCSPYTARIARNYGFFIDRSLGDNGTFYYPKIDLLATIVRIDNAVDLNEVEIDEFKIINSLRANPTQEADEMGPKGMVHVTYNLSV